MKLRKGDKVSVTGIVKYEPASDDRVFIRIDGSYEDLWVKPDLVKLVQAQFDVGDRVGFDINGAVHVEGEILSTSGEHAWIEYSTGEYCTRHFGSIERLPEEPEAAPEVVEPRTAAGSLD